MAITVHVVEVAAAARLQTCTAFPLAVATAIILGSNGDEHHDRSTQPAGNSLSACNVIVVEVDDAFVEVEVEVSS